MSTVHDPSGGSGAIVVSVILEAEHAHALDALCGATLSSRAGMMRRVLVSALRAEGYLPALAPRAGQPRRACTGAEAGQSNG